MSRLIDADAIVEKISLVMNEPDYQHKGEDWMVGLIMARDAIDEQPTVIPEPHWIPVTERLPEESGQYLITVKYEHVDGYEDIYAEHGDWSGGKWDMFGFGHCGKVEDIVAWMPLPEPYKEEIP